MSYEKEIAHLADALEIALGNKGIYTFGDIAENLGWSREDVPRRLHTAGITCKRVGKCKQVTAYDIAKFYYTDRIAPIDNTSNAGRRNNT